VNSSGISAEYSRSHNLSQNPLAQFASPYRIDFAGIWYLKSPLTQPAIVILNPSDEDGKDLNASSLQPNQV
jgi:hypothetical protein